MAVKDLKLTGQKVQGPFEELPLKQPGISPRLITFFSTVIILVLCFSFPLYNLLQLAASNDLYSHIPLIPLISLYLVWMRRENLPRMVEAALKQAGLFVATGLLVVTAYWLISLDHVLNIENYLAINILALLLFFAGACYFFLGKAFMRAIAFPMALLIFTIPFPSFLLSRIETFLQHGSALFAGFFFQLSGVPVIRDGLVFLLPGCTLQVAPECSGIHSTLVLMITSLVGGWLFLRSPWNRVILALAIIPLALIRNGFRIFVIGRLCVAYGPQMLDSPIHHHGGPLFFALSLIPFLLLLVFLKRTERKHR